MNKMGNEFSKPQIVEFQTTLHSNKINKKLKTQVKKTSEVNKICVLLMRERIKTSEDFNLLINKDETKLDAIAKGYKSIMDPNQELDEKGLSDLFQAALSKYYEVDVNFEYLKFKDKSGISQAHTFAGIVNDPTIKGKIERSFNVNAEIKRFEDAYDRLMTSKAEMEALSELLKNRVVSKDVIVVDNLVIGGGDAATEYWLDMHKNSHGKTKEILNKNNEALPATLMLTKDTGNWKHDYTLAQTYSLLERGSSPANPQEYAKSEKYQENRHVNARFLYQANIVNLSETEAPTVLGTEVLGLEKQEKHSMDWKAQTAPCRVKVKIKLEAKTREEPLIITDETLEKLHKSLKIKGKTNIEFANALISSLTGDNSTADLPTKIKKLRTDALMILIKNPTAFEKIKRELSLDSSVTQVDFSRNLQIFIRDVAADTLYVQRKNAEVAEIKINQEKDKSNEGPPIPEDKITLSRDELDTPYQNLDLLNNPEGIPIIINGKLIIESGNYINKHMYCKELNVCSGLGIARDITSKPREIRDPTTKAITDFIPEQITKEDQEALCHYDPNLNYTPVIDGNTYMLTDREENDKKHDIIIYGGGGNATACYRKSFFGNDINAENRVYDDKKQKPTNITWFAKEGFELAGYGRLAKQALKFAKDNDQLCGGELIKIEAKKDGSGKVVVYMKDSPGTYEKKEIEHSPKRSQAHPVNSINFLSDLSDGTQRTKPLAVRKFECDQFIYTIGQEDPSVKTVFGEYDLNKEANVYSDPHSKMPLGVKTSDNVVKFWGAAAMVVSPSFKMTSIQRESNFTKIKVEQEQALKEAEANQKLAKTEEEKIQAEMDLLKAQLLRYKVKEYEQRLDVSKNKESRGQEDWSSEFGENLRDWIVVQRIARDAEWPGVMPPSRTASRQAEFVNSTGGKPPFESINVNLDDIEYINGFLITAGINSVVTRLKFINALLKARENAYQDEKFPGIDNSTMRNLVEEFHITDKVELRGTTSLGIKKSKA